MSLTNENGGSDLVMPVAPMGYGNGGYGGGFGGFGGDWLIILFLFALMGNGFGGGFGWGGGEMTLPYLWNTQTQNDVNRGFDNAGLSSQLSGIQTSISNGFANAEVAECNRAMNSMQTAYTNQIADLERSYAAQTATAQGFNSLTSQLAQCCCDNRLATCQTQNIVQNEGNATRFADANNTRDIITNATANTQAILDKLCQLELDGVKAQVEAKNDRISELQSKLNMAALRESQTAQNAFITQGFTNEVDALYNRLSNCPVPTVPVYGRQPIFTCGDNNGCGCGCGGSF